MDHYSTSVVIESWCLYGIGICLIGCRLISRRIRLGSWKKLQTDDVLMCIIALSFTGVTYTVSEMAQMNNDLVLEDPASSPRKTEQSSYRSKISVTMEQLSVVSLWMIKGCLLLLYNRLTIQSLRTREHRLVQVVAVYVIVTFIVLEILFWAVWCVPPQKYWAYLPAGDRQCTRFWNHLITTTVFNISSDFLILSIPIPLLIRLQISRKKKIATCAVFSLGGLVIVLAAINKYYNLSGTHRAVFLRWHIAELATAVYTSNIPLLWPLCIRVFHKLRGSTGYSQPSEPHRLITAPRQIIPFPAHSIHRKNSKHSIVRVSYERDESKAMLHELALVTPRERGYSAIISGFPGTHPRTTKDITVQRTVEIVHEPSNDSTWTGDSMISPPSPSWRRIEQ